MPFVPDHKKIKQEINAEKRKKNCIKSLFLY